MVAIPTGGQKMHIDLDGLYSGVKGGLPSYARPIFIRLVSEIDMTGMYNWELKCVLLYALCASIPIF